MWVSDAQTADIQTSSNTSSDSLEIESLTPEMQNMVRQMSLQIDLSSSTNVINYGYTEQNKIANFSDNILKSIQSSDLGEAGEALNSLVEELSDYSVLEEEKDAKNNFLTNIVVGFGKSRKNAFRA